MGGNTFYGKNVSNILAAKGLQKLNAAFSHLLKLLPYYMKLIFFIILDICPVQKETKMHLLII